MFYICLSNSGSRIFRGGGGCANSQSGITLETFLFAENCMKIKVFGPPRGHEGRVPLGSANGQSFCSQRGVVKGVYGKHPPRPRGRHPLDPEADTHPPPVETVTEADDMYPTGMHSYLKHLLSLCIMFQTVGLRMARKDANSRGSTAHYHLLTKSDDGFIDLQVNFLFTARKGSLGQDNVFTHVCHSVHRGGGVSQHVVGVYTPFLRRQSPGRHPLVCHSVDRGFPWVDTPPGRPHPGRHPLGRHPPWQIPAPPGQTTSPGQTHTTPSQTPRGELKRVVRFLLECILVLRILLNLKSRFKQCYLFQCHNWA